MKTLIIFFKILLSLNIAAVTVEERLSTKSEQNTYIFNAGKCSFLNGQSFKCQSKETQRELAIMQNRAATDVLEQIRSECTWFDVLSIDKVELTSDKQDLFDSEGDFIGNFAKKYFLVKARYLCERPLT